MLQHDPSLVETCQKKFENFWVIIHEVTALSFHAFCILFESTSCIRLKGGAAKRDVIEGKGKHLHSARIAISSRKMSDQSDCESCAASEASLSNSSSSFEGSDTDQSGDNSSELSQEDVDTATIEPYSFEPVLESPLSVETSVDLIEPDSDISRLDNTDW